MAHPLTVAVLIGSLRKGSFSRKVAQALTKLSPGGLVYRQVGIGQLPLYDQDLDDEGRPPEAWTAFRESIKACDAVLFVTPEYNRSMPGVLKNAIDWGSRPWGKNSWGGKPGAVLGTSIGAIGTALAQQHLRNVLAYLDVAVLGQPEMFIKHEADRIDEKGEIVNDDTRKFLQAFVDRYVAWVHRQLGR